MKLVGIALCAMMLANTVFAQRQIEVSHAEIENVLKGTYDPNVYMPSLMINDRVTVIDGIVNEISTDSLSAYLETLVSFQNRNTGSDTVSTTRGIGAARRWIHGKLKEFSAVNENRLLTGYLDFEELICTMNKHRNVVAVLPGLDTNQKEIVVVEAHMDSRCEAGCDLICDAPGADDNGSGTVLVMELARVMSKYAFDRTIVFTTVTGEEQSLKGSTAWASWLSANTVPVLACFNNDVVGGIRCGASASPPACSPAGDIDSSRLRIFSYSKVMDTATYSPHKQLARYVRLQQEEEINNRIAMPMFIDLQIREDREGRGGDHIPFRKEGYNTIRFTSANEHGDGSGTAPDHQHTTKDVLGVDTDVPPDGQLDSFFVDMNYLSRNAITNGVNLALLALSPPTPKWNLQVAETEAIVAILQDDTSYKDYRVAVRTLGTGSLYFDTVYEVTGVTSFSFNLLPSKTYFVSVANVKNGVESLFSEEVIILPTGREELHGKNVGMTCFPNPASTSVGILLDGNFSVAKEATFVFYDIRGVKVLIQSFPLMSSNQFNIDVAAFGAGSYQCVLFIDGEQRGSSAMLIKRQ
jgi:hypothetical protein